MPCPTPSSHGGWLARITSALLLTACTSVLADDDAAPPAADTERPVVTIGAPQANLPPYFMVANRSGLERDLIADAFRNVGRDVHFIYERGREATYRAHEQGLDCISTVSEHKTDLPGYRSDTVVTYQDSVFFLDDGKTDIRSLADLRGKTIEAFPDAAKVLRLGDLPRHSRYHEHSSKGAQVILLYRGKIDALIMENRFFEYYSNWAAPLIEDMPAVQRREFFRPVHYHITCHDQATRDAFNRGLAKLIADGGNQELIAKYLGGE